MAASSDDAVTVKSVRSPRHTGTAFTTPVLALEQLMLAETGRVFEVEMSLVHLRDEGRVTCTEAAVDSEWAGVSLTIMVLVWFTTEVSKVMAQAVKVPGERLMYAPPFATALLGPSAPENWPVTMAGVGLTTLPMTMVTVRTNRLETEAKAPVMVIVSPEVKLQPKVEMGLESTDTDRQEGADRV